MSNVVWVFLVLINGHISEIGGFENEVTCEQTRQEIIVQRQEIGYGTGLGKPYILNKQFDTTKCFKVWKK